MELSKPKVLYMVLTPLNIAEAVADESEVCWSTQYVFCPAVGESRHVIVGHFHLLPN